MGADLVVSKQVFVQKPIKLFSPPCSSRETRGRFLSIVVQLGFEKKKKECSSSPRMVISLGFITNSMGDSFRKFFFPGD